MECSIVRILTLDMPITYATIRVIDSAQKDVTMACQYAWSVDKVCWTNWVDYNTYMRLAQNLDGDFWLRIKLFGGFSKLIINDNIVSCYNIALDTSNVFLQQLCNSANLFSPYTNLDCALLLQQQLSDLVVCMFGIPIYYFRVLPDKNTADYTFKEYVLHNVVAVKQLKLMIQDGQMPSSKPVFSDWDFDWEVDWEVELSKTAFAAAFGDDAFPKHQDFIYVPMMKRMWNVNAAYDEKSEGLLWRSTTWKLGLVKYNDYTNVDSTDFDSIIDTMIVNEYEKVLGVHENVEQERLSGTHQTEMPKFAANALYNVIAQDAIRAEYNDQLIEVTQEQLNQFSNVSARNFYLMKAGENPAVVNYQKPWCYDSGMISFILKATPESKFAISVGNLELACEDSTIYFNSNQYGLEMNGTYLFIVRFNRGNFTSDIHVYEHKIAEAKKNVPLYRRKPEMSGFDFTNPILSETMPYNNDFSSKKPLPIFIFGSNVYATNFKVYNCEISEEDAIRESVKYTTNHENCLINDLARPFLGEVGFPVR